MKKLTLVFSIALGSFSVPAFAQNGGWSPGTPSLGGVNVVQSLGKINISLSREIVGSFNSFSRNSTQFVNTRPFGLNFRFFGNNDDLQSVNATADVIGSFKDCEAQREEKIARSDLLQRDNLEQEIVNNTDFAGTIYYYSEVISTNGYNIYNFRALAFDRRNSKCYLASFAVNNQPFADTDSVERNGSVAKIIGSLRNAFEKLRGEFSGS